MGRVTWRHAFSSRTTNVQSEWIFCTICFFVLYWKCYLFVLWRLFPSLYRDGFSSEHFVDFSSSACVYLIALNEEKTFLLILFISLSLSVVQRTVSFHAVVIVLPFEFILTIAARKNTFKKSLNEPRSQQQYQTYAWMVAIQGGFANQKKWNLPLNAISKVATTYQI